jgi:hypothetical protein
MTGVATGVGASISLASLSPSTPLSASGASPSGGAHRRWRGGGVMDGTRE